jgi:toxin YoeB
MAADIIFTARALQEYMEWQTKDKKAAERINALMKDILRNGFMKGIGKPERMKRGRLQPLDITFR